MTTYTFTEIAQFARIVEPSQKLGAINYCGMIADLAEALERFEHNTAVLFTACEPRSTPVASPTSVVREALEVLRAEIPPRS